MTGPPPDQIPIAKFQAGLQHTVVASLGAVGVARH